MPNTETFEHKNTQNTKENIRASILNPKLYSTLQRTLEGTVERTLEGRLIETLKISPEDPLS